ncbi:acyl carrier protein [Flavobacterium sp. NRK F10]|uniref:Acyl carrier protein n=1 Tax=Flavobacterium sediminis TaxID=2201181 RepID=A0A2U8QSG8_9FLAO|nr:MULTISPECIES: acyl carrier protein [Flavobacterium]AWM13051.1 acyl carrier protein [Flavobacterium sediminis]MCO6174207.1 acyl carrier protein [Flavobacterium sp. NRK F10]
MNKAEFIKGLEEELELEITLTAETDLKGLDEWDSMAAMLLIGYVSNEFGLTLTADDIKNISTVQSLIERIGVEKFN